MPSSKSSLDNRDIYYRLTKSSGYRARSAYKLIHLDEEFDLFDGVSTAVDLCAAPGSWSQVLSQQLKPGKAEDDNKVVSVDLQPMAPLPNITILQTDITLPSTIPLVLNALGGRKADLVVCDGAPDGAWYRPLPSSPLASAHPLTVTGVHDLDAYLHSQLLLAALTLALTLLAPRATLIFKIFLSPLDPKAAMLRSQLRTFFPGPSSDAGDAFAEFDDNEADSMSGMDRRAERDGKTGNGSVGYDTLGRRGGVWVRKPRSSRKGSGEAFIVCRNFDPSILPLPATFSEGALAELSGQTAGTLTLDSLAHLTGSEVTPSRAWERIKAYVGSGDLDPVLTTEKTSMNYHRTPNMYIQLDTHPARSANDSPAALHAQPTPLEGPSDNEYFSSRSTHLAPAPLHLAMKPRARGLSNASTLSGSSPPSSTHERAWNRSAPSPLPSPGIAYPTKEDAISTSPERTVHSATSREDSDVPSPMSTSSKTDLFFASSPSGLPRPPKPLGPGGKGVPKAVRDRGHDRTFSLPGKSPVIGVEGSRERTISMNGGMDRIVSAPSPVPPPRSVSSTIVPDDVLSTLPTLPSLPDIATRPSHHHRESQQLERESREVPLELHPLQPDDVLVPSGNTSDQSQWRLISKLGEGAFSSVWSASSVPRTDSINKLVAIKILPRHLTATNARTRIAFVREVEVLRHISHPNIVGFVSSFETASHHCLVLEKMAGGEMFELLADECHRKRMLAGGDEGFVRRVFGELARGVGWLHEVGVVHRDIKLENILFTINPFDLPRTANNGIPLDLLPSPLVKLTDFGLSRFIDPTSPLLATRCGSESFAAPEIIMGRAYDGRLTDAWACGVVLYALVVGELPFDADERKRRMMRIAKGVYTWPQGIGSQGVHEVVEVLLRRDPRQRRRVGELWDMEWMSTGQGAVQPPRGGQEPPQTGKGRGKTRILDGFLVDSDEIAEVARLEME
ncbi:kinase-like domain-containing protein [Naematelia encephala]|uniref:Kinase-like domain-containing protein n=1 Tax=Naematelia encephala TaxID=71784 RepID=A0A1Y2BHH9_9TREE|nr:kinase-like domain-containing protein [Naematelia encephala]